MSVIQKAITLKILPTNQQAELLQKSFGCTRFVYNHFLGIAIDYDRIRLSEKRGVIWKRKFQLYN